MKKAREAKKLSQQEVAHLLEVSQKTLSNFESGKTVPNILQIAKLGLIYGLDMIELLEKSGVLQPPFPPRCQKAIQSLNLETELKSKKITPPQTKAGFVEYSWFTFN
ncbi:helix-turn-helix domain-containing protein [Algoriphagus faecimaris]|uniref:helix-turn-helix domain-containing protein n=1 Tax=Algoriphagus faecimaris TaxID=686796 RepID=UPI00146ED571|nr:helix-turn-helix transcriptional regulator [Algoriphagus faecimaris]